MFNNRNFKNRYLWIAVFTSHIFSAAALADPIVLPPPDGAIDPPPVFCFGVTGGDILPGGGIRVQFQVLNWTGETAQWLQISQNGAPAGANTGGLFLADPSDPQNSWTHSEILNGPGSLVFAAPAGEGLQGIDLDPNNDLDFVDAPTLPNPLDSGINALDGFILEFPDLDVYERVTFFWLLGATSIVDPVDSGLGAITSLAAANPFSFGTFQIDRASNGSVRLATAFSIGTQLTDIGPNPAALDPTLTEQNAVTVAPTALAAVPLPTATWLMLSGLVGLATVARTRRKTRY